MAQTQETQRLTVRTARYHRGYAHLVALLVLCSLGAWALRHIYHLYVPVASSNALNAIYVLSFLSLAWTNLLAALERPYTATMYQQDQLDKLAVSVLIPAYNEDEALLKACIHSLLIQTRKPQHIEIVDDGSTATDYQSTRDWLECISQRHDLGLTYRWTRTANGGKRHAQAVGMVGSPKADIYLTLDSDTVLDPQAIAEGLKPFADKRVQSVAGLCLAINQHDNLLTRFTGLWETMWQLVDRSSQSTAGVVTVNSGILAFYRGRTIRHYLKPYLREQFFRTSVKFSDDSLMTLYALHHGKTVQQPTSIAFSAVPNRYSHHIRRYIRWMRGSLIRSWWRNKYLPVTSYVWWLHTGKWLQFALSSAASAYLLLSGTVLHSAALPYLLLVPTIIAYIQSLRYFTVTRSDEGRGQQLLTFLTAPIAMFWLLTVLRAVKWYAYATVKQTKWGTRGKVEVGIAGQQA